MEEIINKVANSVLEVFDLEDYYPQDTSTNRYFMQWLRVFYYARKTFERRLKITIGRNTKINM
jgi:hypothetical protein